jgi:ubiquinone/menaquinone biosynthesis C-methylase UbiE
MGLGVRLSEALRGRSTPPQERLADVGVERGMKVADIGAGYGYFTLAAAEIVGEEGRVYAIEPNKKRADEIGRRVEEGGVKNVTVITAGAERLDESLKDGAVQLAMSMSSFHHFVDPQKALAEMAGIVQPGGVVYIRDMKPGRLLKHGSDPEAFRAAIGGRFANARFEEDSRYVTARITV